MTQLTSDAASVSVYHIRMDVDGSQISAGQLYSFSLHPKTTLSLIFTMLTADHGSISRSPPRRGSWAVVCVQILHLEPRDSGLSLRYAPIDDIRGADLNGLVI